MAFKINGSNIISSDGNISNVGIATFGLLDAKINEKIITESPSITGTTDLDQILIYDVESDSPKKMSMQEFVPGANNIGTLNLEGPVGGFRNAIVNGSFRIDNMTNFRSDSRFSGQSIDLRISNPVNARVISAGWRTHLSGSAADTIDVTYGTKTAYLDGETPPDNITTYLDYSYTSSGISPTAGVFLDAIVENYNTFMGSDVTYSFYAKSGTGSVMKIQPIFAFVRGKDASGNYNPPVDEYVLPAVDIQPFWGRYQVNFTFPISTDAINKFDAHMVLRFILASGNTYANSIPGGVPLTAPSGRLLLTGAQVERGSEATKYEEYDLSTEYLRSQRFGTYEFCIFNTDAQVLSVNSPPGPASNKTVTFRVSYRCTTSIPFCDGTINLQTHPQIESGNFGIVAADGSVIYLGNFNGVSLTNFVIATGTFSYDLNIVQNNLNRVPNVGEAISFYNLHHYYDLSRATDTYLFPAP